MLGWLASLYATCASVSLTLVLRILNLVPFEPRKRGVRRARQNKSSGMQSRAARMAPQQISSNIVLRHTYRFVSTSGLGTALTPTSLLCAAGTMGVVVNTQVNSFFASVRIRRIVIYTPPASQGSNATCSVDWVGFNNSPNIEQSDTTVSVAQPAIVSTSPPASSLASFWQVAGTATLCTLTAPTGSIIDVSLDLILTDDDAGTLANSTVATAALGIVYYLSLDPNATHRYTPVSLTTTF
jgi:hypothetical protein